jgi:hypothetical protein
VMARAKLSTAKVDLRVQRLPYLEHR